MVPPLLKRCPIMYEKNKEMIDAHIAAVLPQILQKMNFKEDGLILDHGCGSGSTGAKYFYPLIEKSNSTLYNFDVCDNMLSYAKDKFPHKNVKYVSGNLQENPKELIGLKFDAIFSLYTIHFIENYEAELKALYDLLTPGGEMFAMILVDVHLFDLYHQVKKNDKWSGKADHHLVIPKWRDGKFKNYEEFFRKEFTQVGFKVKEFSLEEKTYIYPRPGVYADMMFGLNGSQKQLNHDDHDELKDVYNDFFVKTETKYHKHHHKSHESKFHMHYDCLDILVQKPLV